MSDAPSPSAVTPRCALCHGLLFPVELPDGVCGECASRPEGRGYLARLRQGQTPRDQRAPETRNRHVAPAEPRMPALETAETALSTAGLGAVLHGPITNNLVTNTLAERALMPEPLRPPLPRVLTDHDRQVKALRAQIEALRAALARYGAHAPAVCPFLQLGALSLHQRCTACEPALSL